MECQPLSVFPSKSDRTLPASFRSREPTHQNSWRRARNLHGEIRGVMECCSWCKDFVADECKVFAVWGPTVDVDGALTTSERDDVGLLAALGPHAAQDHVLVCRMLHGAGRKAD